MNQVKLVVRNQLSAELGLHGKQAVQDFLPRLNGEGPRNVLARDIEGQAPVAADGTALSLVVPDGDKPVAEGNQRLVGVLA